MSDIVVSCTHSLLDESANGLADGAAFFARQLFDETKQSGGQAQSHELRLGVLGGSSAGHGSYVIQNEDDDQEIGSMRALRSRMST